MQRAWATGLRIKLVSRLIRSASSLGNCAIGGYVGRDRASWLACAAASGGHVGSLRNRRAPPRAGGESDRVRAEQYYKTYGPIAYRRCVHLLADAKAAQDATCEVFTKLLCEPDKFEGSAPAVAAWVYRSTTRLCLRRFRTAKSDSRSGVRPDARGAHKP